MYQPKHVQRDVLLGAVKLVILKIYEVFWNVWPYPPFLIPVPTLHILTNGWQHFLGALHIDWNVLCLGVRNAGDI